MKKPTLSVIIPHYNIPELLSRCIRSIPEIDTIQVIVVDDCSPGASEYKKDIKELSRTNVEYFSTLEGGSAGRARNEGLKHALGEWVTFIDADDLFMDNMYDLFLQIKDSEKDVVFFQVKSVMSDNLEIKSDRNLFQYHFKHYFETKDESPIRYEFDAPWGKFIKKKFLDKFSIRFEEIRYSNDTIFSVLVGIYARSIEVIPDIIYIVTERQGSLTSAKIKGLEEWNIRYGASLRVQQLLDKERIKYKRYAFTDFIIQLWPNDKHRYIREFCKLSLRNKYRVLYVHLRNFLRHN